MTDHEFIREFKKIKLSKICRDLKVNQSNITNGTASEKTMREIKDILLKEILMLMIKYKGDDLILVGVYSDMFEKLEKENLMLRDMI